MNETGYLQHTMPLINENIAWCDTDQYQEMLTLDHFGLPEQRW